MMQATAPYDLPTDTTPIPLAAEMYARLGFSVVPVYGLIGNRCLCGTDCAPNEGKHPIGDNWTKRATSDIDAVRDLFRGHTGNIGLMLGKDLVALDIDEYAGGLEGLAELGSMPPTLTSRSGSGNGQHRIFAYGPGQDPREVTNRKVAKGVDVKTRGGQIVVAPSMHKSGGRYVWSVVMHPAELPDALYDRIRKPRTVAPVIPLHSTTTNADALRRRVTAYVQRYDRSIQGSGGSDVTFNVARSLHAWIAKGLPEHEAWSLFLEYNATKCDPAWSDRELKHKWEDARKADKLPVIEDREPPAMYGGPPPGAPPSTDPAEPTESAGPTWKQRLVWQATASGKQKIAQHHENAIVVLRYHPEWQGRIRLNVHAQRVTVTDPPWHDSDSHGAAAGTNEWTDADSARLSSWLKREVFQLDLGVGDIDRAVAVVAESDTYHPFRDYLRSLQWDSVPRLTRWLTTYLGAESTPYTELVGRWWLTAAVARTFQPGCKVDNVLILEGAQGIKKSSALRTLAGTEYFTDTPIDIGSKDAYLSLQGRIVVELAELDSLKRADADKAKTFFSSPIDVYRPPYARRNVSVPRGCVFAGTVNHASYLQDDTGNRRYWPVRCTSVDLEALAADRDQLWAEAVSMYEDGAKWWPDSAEEAAACHEEQAPRAESDVWEGPIDTFLVGKTDTSIGELLAGPLKMVVTDWTRADQMRVARILAQRGWERYRAPSSHGNRPWRYRLLSTSKSQR